MLLQLTTAQTLGRHPTIAREGRVYLAGPPTLAMPPCRPDLRAPFCSLSGPLCPAEQASLQFINKPCSRPLQDLSPEPSPRPEHPSHEHPSSALNSSTASSGADALPQPCGPRCPEQPSALPGVCSCHHLLNDRSGPRPRVPRELVFPLCCTLAPGTALPRPASLWNEDAALCCFLSREPLGNDRRCRGVN